MPVIPGFFKRYDEIANCSSDFVKMLMNDEYKSSIINSRLAGFATTFPQNTNKPTEHIEKFFDRLVDTCNNVHNYLMNLCRFADPNFIEYEKNSLMYYIPTRNKDILYRQLSHLPAFPSYPGLDDELSKEFSTGFFGYFMCSICNIAIYDLPVLKPENYNVQWWTRGYQGQMAYIGANTCINPQGNKFAGFYAFPDSLGANMIHEGDIISNRGPLLAYAYPYKAMEFCLRQSMNYPDSTLPENDVYEDFFARRIIFEIDFISARNICPWTDPGKEELIFPADCRFKVIDIEESVFNGITLGLIVRLIEIKKEDVKHIRYRDLLSGEYYDNPSPLNIDTSEIYKYKNSKSISNFSRQLIDRFIELKK